MIKTVAVSFFFFAPASSPKYRFQNTGSRCGGSNVGAYQRKSSGLDKIEHMELRKRLYVDVTSSLRPPPRIAAARCSLISYHLAQERLRTAQRKCWCGKRSMKPADDSSVNPNNCSHTEAHFSAFMRHDSLSHVHKRVRRIDAAPGGLIVEYARSTQIATLITRFTWALSD